MAQEIRPRLGLGAEEQLAEPSDGGALMAHDIGQIGIGLEQLLHRLVVTILKGMRFGALDKLFETLLIQFHNLWRFRRRFHP
jgi:hypothetical protein